MSGLARMLAGRGHTVSGSDSRGSAVLDRLRAEGIETWAGHRPELLADVDLVVASSAVPDSDPELVEANRAGAPVWRRPRLLEEITGRIPTIGATGTHGKTSTTAMIVTGARAAGRDPSFVVGGDLVDSGTNAAAGTDDMFVLEVDEAFGTFEHIRLRGLVVTNVEADHLDHFKTVDRVQEAFERVASGVEGPLFACVDDEGSRRLLATSGAVGYGTGADATWRISDIETAPDGSTFRITSPAGGWEVALPRPGLHMARNAAGAIALLHGVGVDPAAAIRGLAGFAGVGRRWDVRGSVGGITVVDDYAHHPTEVTATLDAARRSGRRVVAVFQPHLYSRTRDHAEAFGRALASADEIVVLDVYGAREEPVEGVDSSLIVDASRRAGADAVHLGGDRHHAPRVVVDLVRPGDLVVCMGAGDVTEVPAEVLRLLGDEA